MTVFVTFSAWAGIAGLPGRSERQKTTPVSMGAGRRTIVTLRPVCRPTPVARTAVLSVRWRIMEFPELYQSFMGTDHLFGDRHQGLLQVCPRISGLSP